MKIIEELPLSLYGNEVGDPVLVDEHGCHYSRDETQASILLKIQEIIKILNHAAEVERQNTESLPCPFCGENPELSNSSFGWAVTCKTGILKTDKIGCSVRPMSDFKKTKQEAVDAWNRRL